MAVDGDGGGLAAYFVCGGGVTSDEWASVGPEFVRGEFVCPHCGHEEMEYGFLQKLQLARKLLQRPILVTSGWRCETHNAEVGGSPTSSHLCGRAADLSDHTEPIFRGWLFAALWAAGFRQMEVSTDGHLHVMEDPQKPSPFVGIEG